MNAPNKPIPSVRRIFIAGFSTCKAERQDTLFLRPGETVHLLRHPHTGLTRVKLHKGEGAPGERAVSGGYPVAI